MTFCNDSKARPKLAATVLALAICGLPASAQQTAVPASSEGAPVERPPAPTNADVAPEKIEKRVFGVLPNYRTASGQAPFEPITAKQKLTIAAKDSFDWPLYLLSGAFAGLYQLENSNPSFGQGMKGYAQRYGTSYGDQMIGNMLAEGVIPSLIHEDPRYFRKGQGSFKSRLFYAATRTLVAKSDRGNWRFNYSEWVGNAIGAGISNAYYPDNRSLKDTGERLVISVGTDTVSNIMKEFWPDIKRKYFHKRVVEPATTVPAP